MTHDSFTQRHSFGIGIDFGTSNSAAAIFDGETVTMINLDKDNGVMPSANYLDKDFVARVGQVAIDQYISDNRGRRVELSAELLGEERTSTGGSDGPAGESDTSKVFGHAINDAGLPGRLFRGTKRLLGGNSEKLLIFNRPFRLVALITPILLGIQKAIRSQLKMPSSDSTDHACLGHPVNFEGVEDAKNSTAMQRLQEAYGYAGVAIQTFCPEPTAAAISYLHSTAVNDEKRLLTVDFGGGTLDFCILKCLGRTFEVEATYGIGLGGDRIDQLIFAELIFPLLGKGERWSRVVDGLMVDTLFPFGDFEELLVNWPVSYMLNQNKYTAPVMQRMADNDEAAVKFRRLYDLIKQNYGYQVFEAIKLFKAELSVHTSAILDIPELDIEVELERWEFELMISDLLFELEQAIAMTLNKANLSNKDIDIVLRTGGSSLIPAVRDILENQFGEKVVEHDPFTSVASGLAIADFFGYGSNA